MGLPTVAIVGRPNVGKSSMFNWLAGRRIAIVDPTSGVTRDRVTTIVEVDGQYFELMDTGGMGVVDKDGLTDQIELQITTAIQEAALVLFVVDAQSGRLPLDELVAQHLRYCDKPVLCVANKCDNRAFEQNAQAEFYQFGRKLILASVTRSFNREELLTEILARLPKTAGGRPESELMKIAVVGKRNAGKSTFINYLAQAERVIVSEIPGTTRDSIDVRFEHHGRTFIAIDTAGVRKTKSLADSIEFYSFARAKQTIRRADVVLFFLDPTTRISKVDKQLAGEIMEHHKPCIFVVNKWDLMRPMPTGKFDHYINESFPNLSFAPRAFITAISGKNIQALIDLTQSLFNQTNTRMQTAELNKILRAAMEKSPPPMRQNKRPRIHYATQVGTAPPSLLLFCNDPKLFDATYQTYLLNFFRDHLPFAEVPIRLFLRSSPAKVADKEPADGPDFALADEMDTVDSLDVSQSTQAIVVPPMTPAPPPKSSRPAELDSLDLSQTPDLLELD